MSSTKTKKPPLTAEEKAEKLRLKSAIARKKPIYERENQQKLTQEKLGELVGEMINGKAMSQGAIWQFLSPDHDTKLNGNVVRAICAILDIDVAEISPRFIPFWIKESAADYSSEDIEIFKAVTLLNRLDKDKVMDYARLLLLRERVE